MKSLKSYIETRKIHDPEFSKDYDKKYEEFKASAMLKAAREAVDESYSFGY